MSPSERSGGRIKRGGIITVAAIALAAGAYGVYHIINPGTPSQPNTPAQYYIATNGNDANNCSQPSPCLTLARGYSKAVNGDTVAVAAGTYSAPQTISFDATKNINGPAVTFVPSGGHVKFTADLNLGHQFCNGSPPPAATDAPDYITFAGGTNRDFEWGDRTHEVHIQVCPVAYHITFDHVKIGIEMPLTGP